MTNDRPVPAADGGCDCASRPADESAGRRRKRAGLTPGRLAVVVVLIAGLVAFFAFDLDSYVTFESLKQNRAWLLAQVAENYVLTVIAFITLYAVMVAFSIPGAAVMSLTGGFLFGWIFGTIWNVLAATIGSTALFIAARTALSDALHRKAGPWLDRLEAGFQKNAFSYLLAMRLVPLFPFFAVNLVPAFLGVRLRTFVTATFIGIIPGGFVYTSAGAGLGSVFESGETFTVYSVLTPQTVTAMVGLAALSLLPVAYRLIRGRRR